MKLTTFTRDTSRDMRLTKPIIHIDPKMGMIGINRNTCEIVGLAEGDKVYFVMDELDKGWYIQKTSHDNGFVLREKKFGYMYTNNTRVARAITGSLGVELPVTFMVSKNAIKHDGYLLFPMIVIKK